MGKMGHLLKHCQVLEKLIDCQIMGCLDERQREILYRLIITFLQEPSISEYKLQLIAVQIIKMGVDYELYVSSLIFRMLPDEFTKRELGQLEEELYNFIEKELQGKGFDQRITLELIQQVTKLYPHLNQAMAKRKVLGNWGWLLPHALTQLVINHLMELIDKAKLEANQGKNKKRIIRIKKMH
jgi:hypothetical protein